MRFTNIIMQYKMPVTLHTVFLFAHFWYHRNIKFVKNANLLLFSQKKNSLPTKSELCHFCWVQNNLRQPKMVPVFCFSCGWFFCCKIYLPTLFTWVKLLKHVKFYVNIVNIAQLHLQRFYYLFMHFVVCFSSYNIENFSKQRF